MGAKLFSSEGVETSIPIDRGLDFDRSETHVGGADSAFVVGGENANVGGGARLGVLATIVRLDKSHVIIEIQFSDSPCRSLMQIDRPGMDKSECTRSINSANQ